MKRQDIVAVRAFGHYCAGRLAPVASMSRDTWGNSAVRVVVILESEFDALVQARRPSNAKKRKVVKR